jgi:tRNA-Thr(GGU) m(6)t(6)A37 methyltransferase TsaA
MKTLRKEAPSEFVMKPIGVIRSPITEPHDGPRRGNEARIGGKLIVDEEYKDALFGMETGRMIVILYWMHLAERDLLQVHPRGDRSRPLRGVFTTRSPHRPNPVSIETVEVTGVDGTTIDVIGLDAVDGTPLLDIKCV